MKNSKCRSAGFTLVELVVVVAIIGILAAFAYPSYTNYVRKTRRANAQNDLMLLANSMERFFAANDRYVNADNSAITLPFIRSPQTGPTIFYDLEFDPANPATTFTYTLRALPKDSQVDDRCGTLTINQAGIKGADEADCWL